MLDKTKFRKDPKFLGYRLAVRFWHSIEKEVDLFQTEHNKKVQLAFTS